MDGTVVKSPAPEAIEGLSRHDLLDVYRVMLRSRKLDDKEIQLRNQNRIFFQISGAGHEAVQVAAGLTLKPGYDWFHPYYRDRALALQLGLTSLDILLAGVGAERDPSNGGRQMPSHWGSPERHIVAGSSATATQVLHAVGMAEAGVIYERVTAIPNREAHFNRDEIIYVSLGEGATSEGEFWEALNTACTKQLPVLFLIEDNGYAISVPVEVQTPGGDISKLLRSLPSMHIESIDGTDFFASLRAMREAAAYVRARKGPALVHARVIRPYSHSHSDDERFYKTPAEREAEARRDPLTRFADFLRAQSLATTTELSTIGAELDVEIETAVLEALESPQPPRSSAGLWVYSPDVDPTSAAFATQPVPEGSPETIVDAINHTLKDEMARDPRIVVFGEDVADASRSEVLPAVKGKGGVFKVTHGLQRLYGNDRVFNAPIAEANIVGRAVGMAARGLKPVVEIQFFDYIWPAMMQIRNELAMLRYRSGNHFSCPVVVRVPIGGYLRGGGRTTASPVKASSRTAPDSESPIRRTRPMRPDFCELRFGATTQSCSSNTNTCTARPTTGARTPVRSSWCRSGVPTCGGTVRTSWSLRGARWCSVHCWPRIRLKRITSRRLFWIYEPSPPTTGRPSRSTSNGSTAWSWRMKISSPAVSGRDRGTDCGRAISTFGRSNHTRGRARHAGRLRAGTRGSDPAPGGGRSRRDTGIGSLLISQSGCARAFALVPPGASSR
jgi:2-oxoisovalerate dehydrogenase E1 component